MTGYAQSEIDQIAVWLRQGDSASQVASKLSSVSGRSVSRNSIIGIVHRNKALVAVGFSRGNPSPGSGQGSIYTAAEIELVAKGLQAKKNYAQIARQLAGKSGRAISRFGVKSLVLRTPELKEIGFQGKKGRPSAKGKVSPGQLPGKLFLAVTSDLDREPTAFDYLTRPSTRVVGAQAHFVAMRFIDCLFDRCRAPLSSDLEEKPGPDMLCCGVRVEAGKSYCAYHDARLTSREHHFLAEAA